MKKKTYEDFHDIIEEELAKRAHLYQLKARMDIGWEDFAQECRCRVVDKFHLYQQDKPFRRWVGTLIRNFMTNWMRDNYYRYSPPCAKCPLAACGGCLYTKSGLQDESCPFMAKWLKSPQKDANNINLPLSTENHFDAVNSIPNEQIDYFSAKSKLEIELKKILSPFHWRVYYWLFVRELTEEKVVEKIGFKKEKGRSDCKQLRDAVFVIKEASRKILSNEQIDIF